MSSRRDRGRGIHDYFDVVAPSDGSLGPIVVGGQAANAWAIYYSERIGPELQQYSPFTSKDLDLAGDRKLLESIKRTTQGQLTFSEPRSPVIGMVETGSGDSARKIEVLRDVKGLKREELDDAIPVSVGGLIVRLLSPPKVLRAKFCNVVILDQSDRNDVNHTRIMILCVREFILDVLASVSAGTASQRDLIDVLEEVREIVLDSHAQKAISKWRFDLGRVWPRDQLEACGFQKVQRFVQHRLPPKD